MVFTDIEGSTRLLEALGRERYAKALDQHRRLLREAFEQHRGFEVDCEGDSFFVAFERAEDAVAATARAQQSLAAAAWPKDCELRVRIGIHTGEPLVLPSKYVGLDVHRAARIMAAGHGGQVLLSGATQQLLDDAAETISLGEHTLKDLLRPEPLYQLRIDGLPLEFPALKTLGNRPTNLPMQPNALVGREAELRNVIELLRGDARFLTLTGPGGTGKTRLALQAGAELLEDFASGVFFVSLAPLDSAAQVVPSTAQALAVREVPGEALVDTLAGYLEQKQMLLVLDNFEHVLGAAVDVAGLLDRCSQLHVLVTSRERLRLRREQVYPVPPLALVDPAADVDAILVNEAVALFVARAYAAGGDFTLTADDARVVAEICARLDGLPLAIELAAARAVSLTPPALLRRLDQRLPLLTGGARDVDERQRTLRATIQWSYELLGDVEQRLFERLSAFVDGCRFEAAQAVCDSNQRFGIQLLDALDALVEKSLLRVRADSDGEPRYWMLETIREYAVSQVDGAAWRSLREQHAMAFFQLATELSEASGAPETEWLHRIDADYPNVRAALDWFQETDPRRALQLALRLNEYWHRRGQLRDARRLLEDALTRSADLVTAQDRLQALTHVAGYQQLTGDYGHMASTARQALQLATELRENAAIARATRMLARAEALSGSGEAARERLEAALDQARLNADEVEVARFARDLGMFSGSAGNFDLADQLINESVLIFRKLDQYFGIALCLLDLGGLASERGEHAKALDLLRECAAMYAQQGDTFMTTNVLLEIAGAFAGTGDPLPAVQLAAYVEERFDRMGFAKEPGHLQVLQRLQEKVILALSPQEIERAERSGREMTVEEALRVAGIPSNLASAVAGTARAAQQPSLR